MGANGISKRTNEVFTGQNKPIDIDIIIEMKKCICKIIINKGKETFYGTGFFMKVSDSLKYLVTNHHVIDLDSSNDKIEIEIWNKKRYILNINNFKIKYLKEPKDIFIIELKNINGIFKEVKFLSYDKNYEEDGYIIYKGAEVFTIEHPLGKNSSYSNGKINDITGYEFSHTVSTDQGSSGCPIMLLNNNINFIKVIGIHKSGKKREKMNYGTFIGEIIKEIKNDANNYITAEINIEENDINKNIRIINSYEESMRNINKNNEILKDRMNEKEIKECEIKINDSLIKFNYYHKFITKGKYLIKYSFKTKLTKLNCLFNNCEYLTEINFSNFSTQNITDMSLMFNKCKNLKEIKGINHFNTNKVIDMSVMFQFCSELEILDLTNFDTSNVINMQFMFNKCKKLKEIKGINKIFTAKVIDMNCMFQSCGELKNLDLINFNTFNVTDMKFMFNECKHLKEIKGINKFDTTNVKDMKGLFKSCGELEKLDLSKFNTLNATDMSFMFDGCKKLKEIKGINNFITNKVTNMEGMFGECEEIEILDLSNFETSIVTNMSFMFNKCKKLKEIKGINKFITKNVTKMFGMFQSCGELEYLNLSNFESVNVKDMSFMFNGCKKLRYLNLQNFSLNGESERMFCFMATDKCEFITNDEELLKLFHPSEKSA